MGKDAPLERRRRATSPGCRLYCEIAGSVVHATLRGGHGLGEPGRLYVRCEERDCQYVDLNQAPCPLHVDLFRERSDDLIRDYFTRFPTSEVCFRCVGVTVGARHEDVRYAVSRLAEQPGWRVAVFPAFCIRCGARRVTVSVTPPLAGSPSATADETSAVVDVLRGAPEVALCVICLAFATRRTLFDMRRIRERLRTDARLTEAHGLCGMCGHSQELLRAVHDQEGRSS